MMNPQAQFVQQSRLLEMLIQPAVSKSLQSDRKLRYADKTLFSESSSENKFTQSCVILNNKFLEK